MTNRQWIKAVLDRQKGLPIPQQWMSFFNADTARRLTPEACHYPKMSIYDVEDNFNFSAQGPAVCDAMIRFNRYTDRCMVGLGQGANLAFGHGGPGEFYARRLRQDEHGLLVEYETTVKAKLQYNPHFYHHYDYPVQCIQDVEKLPLPNPGDLLRYQGLAADTQYLKSRGEYVIASLNGFFSGIHYFLMDFQNTLIALAAEPRWIQAAVEKLGQWNLTAAAQLIAAGVDGLALCDDLGSKKSLLMSPAQYRAYFKPWHQKLCRLAHEKNVTVHLHSHGAVSTLLDDFAECGFDFINPFDPEEGFDLEDILKRYASRFIVVGGMPASFWEYSFEQKAAHLKKITQLGLRYGSFILMDSGGVCENISARDFAQVLTLSRELRKQSEFMDMVAVEGNIDD